MSGASGYEADLDKAMEKGFYAKRAAAQPRAFACALLSSKCTFCTNHTPGFFALLGGAGGRACLACFEDGVAPVDERTAGASSEELWPHVKLEHYFPELVAADTAAGGGGAGDSAADASGSAPARAAAVAAAGQRLRGRPLRCSLFSNNLAKSTFLARSRAPFLAGQPGT